MGEIRELMDDFQLMKLKVFSASGETLYSSEPQDVGAVVTKSYFHEMVAPGNAYARMVKKDRLSSEGQKVTADVVETYIPIMRNGKFLGALEIYYDITQRRQELESLVRSSSIVVFIVAFGLLATVIGISFKTAKAEVALHRAHQDLEHRTVELKEVNAELGKEVADRMRFAITMERFALQQASVAEIGSLAQSGLQLQELMDTTVRLVAEAMEVELCKILTYESSNESLRLVSGVGWSEEVVGSATVGVGLESQAGYTLRERGPVIVKDLSSETRFSGPPLLLDYGVVSGISVPMVADDFVFGVMGAHTRQRRNFSEDDINFMEAVANIITTTAQRNRAEERLLKTHQELQQAYETLERAQASAIVAAKLAALGRLTAGACHEILNPLNIIKARFQLLLDDPGISPEMIRCLKTLDEQADRIHKITMGLAAFSRQRPLERQQLDLNENVVRILGLMERDLNFDNIVVDVKFADDLPPVSADQNQLQQVVLNLLNNARSVMPDGGSIVMSTGCVQVNGKQLVELRVEDTGAGIAVEDMDKLFEPFFTTKPEGEGAGLGLAICQGIVESHGGSIWAENVPDGGAAFVIQLPIETFA
jgi:signal transduction histidine kinase